MGTAKTYFYTYYQNKSGGIFNINDQVSQFVIIEATSPKHADILAQEVGIYFNGCENGLDCECCGDRWSDAYTEGTETPTIYDKPAEEFKSNWVKPDKAYCYIYYLDGTKKALIKESNNAQV
jgi:hypothetical protein